MAALRARRLAGGAGGVVGRSGVRAVLVTVLAADPGAGAVRVALAGLARRRLAGTGPTRADTARADRHHPVRARPGPPGRPARPARAVLLAGNLARLLPVRVAGLTAVRACLLTAVLVTAVLPADWPPPYWSAGRAGRRTADRRTGSPPYCGLAGRPPYWSPPCCWPPYWSACWGGLLTAGLALGGAAVTLGEAAVLPAVLTAGRVAVGSP